MRNKNTIGECLAVIGSMTKVMRAQGVLAAAAIRAQVINIASKQGSSGCAYALSFPCAQAENVKRILSSAGIRVREYRGEWSDLS